MRAGASSRYATRRLVLIMCVCVSKRSATCVSTLFETLVGFTQVLKIAWLLHFALAAPNASKWDLCIVQCDLVESLAAFLAATATARRWFI